MKQLLGSYFFTTTCSLVISFVIPLIIYSITHSALWTALIYAVFPVDLLPDPIYLDDIGVMAGAIGYITHLARKYQIVEHLRTAARDRISSRQIER